MATLTWHGDKVHAKLTAAIFENMEEGAEDLVNAVKANAPVKTGKLRRSVKVLKRDRKAKAVQVGTDVDYGLFLEVGTRKMAATHWFSNGLREGLSKIRARLNKRVT